MAKHTSKGQGRQRELLHLPKNAPEGKGEPDNHAGDGQIGGVGVGPQADDCRPAESWVEFVGRVNVAMKFYKNRLRTVWHPDPLLDIIYTDHANIAVKKGVVKGQLNTSQFVDL